MAEEWKEVSRGTITKLDEDNPSAEGTLVEIRDGLYGPLFDIKLKDGSVITLPSDTVLQTKLNKNMVGREIKVEFVGMIASTRRKGKDYKNYAVYTKE